MNPHVQTAQNKYGKGGYRLCTAGSLRPSYGRPKLILISRRSKCTLSGVRNNLSAKIVKIQPSHGISGILIHIYSVAGLNFENGQKVIFNITLILLATYVLPAPPNIGQAKDGQKGAAATFSPKRRFFLYV